MLVLTTSWTTDPRSIKVILTSWTMDPRSIKVILTSWTTDPRSIKVILPCGFFVLLFFCLSLFCVLWPMLPVFLDYLFFIAPLFSLLLEIMHDSSDKFYKNTFPSLVCLKYNLSQTCYCFVRVGGTGNDTIN